MLPIWNTLGTREVVRNLPHMTQYRNAICESMPESQCSPDSRYIAKIIKCSAIDGWHLTKCIFPNKVTIPLPLPPQA